jgi:hypothetical protein
MQLLTTLLHILIPKNSIQIDTFPLQKVGLVSHYL